MDYSLLYIYIYILYCIIFYYIILYFILLYYIIYMGCFLWIQNHQLDPRWFVLIHFLLLLKSLCFLVQSTFFMVKCSSLVVKSHFSRPTPWCQQFPRWIANRPRGLPASPACDGDEWVRHRKFVKAAAMGAVWNWGGWGVKQEIPRNTKKYQEIPRNTKEYLDLTHDFTK